MYYKGFTDDDKVDYLKSNSVAIDIQSFELHDNFIDAPKEESFNVYVLGEFHGFSPTHIFDAVFFKYLNKNFGVRDYCSEFFTQDADSLNLFLYKDCIDARIVRNVMVDIAKDNIPQWKTDEYNQKWISLYNYNKTLPDSARIRVHGLLGDKRTYNGNRDQCMEASMIKLREDNKL